MVPSGQRMRGTGEMRNKPWSLRQASVRMFALGWGRVSALAKKVVVGGLKVTAEHGMGCVGGDVGSGGA